jgi:hypothetical protein
MEAHPPFDWADAFNILDAATLRMGHHRLLITEPALKAGPAISTTSPDSLPMEELEEKIEPPLSAMQDRRETLLLLTRVGLSRPEYSYHRRVSVTLPVTLHGG